MLYGGHGVSLYSCIGLGYVYTLILDDVYICYRDVHGVYSGPGVSQYTCIGLGYVYTPIVE